MIGHLILTLLYFVLKFKFYRIQYFGNSIKFKSDICFNMLIVPCYTITQNL